MSACRSWRKTRARWTGSPAIDRRSFVGYVLAGTTLVAAADLALGGPARAAASGVSGPQVAEFYDLNDFIDQTCLPTASMVTVTVHTDGTASFVLPRSENGQGITTSTAMIIAEELELPVTQGEGHAGRRAAGAALQPAHRRLVDHHVDLHADPGGGGRRQGCAPGGGGRRCWVPS